MKTSENPEKFKKKSFVNELESEKSCAKCSVLNNNTIRMIYSHLRLYNLTAE